MNNTYKINIHRGRKLKIYIKKKTETQHHSGIKLLHRKNESKLQYKGKSIVGIHRILRLSPTHSTIHIFTFKHNYYFSFLFSFLFSFFLFGDFVTFYLFIPIFFHYISVLWIQFSLSLQVVTNYCCYLTPHHSHWKKKMRSSLFFV